MAIAAKISPAELTAQVTDRFAGKYLEARLIYAPGTAYLPGITDDATFLGFEVTPGTSGYQRQVISYTADDVGAYTDAGVGLTTRATIFAHDGTSGPLEFSHVALCWSDGNVSSIASVGTTPSAGVNGTYTNIPIDSTTGTGSGLTVDLTITGDGATSSNYAVSVVSPGIGYADGDVMTILEGTLAGLGAVAAGAGNLAFEVGGVAPSASNAGDILSVAQTSGAVSLTGGNEAAFYWNLKQFGFHNTSSS